MENKATDKFSDRTDVTRVIALFEYGLMRNPNTDKTIICLNHSSKEHTKENKPVIRVQHISFDDVKTALLDAEDGYYRFIGSSRLEELKELDNNWLSHHIHSLNQYSGHFIMEYYD